MRTSTVIGSPREKNATEVLVVVLVAVVLIVVVWYCGSNRGWNTAYPVPHNVNLGAGLFIYFGPAAPFFLPPRRPRRRVNAALLQREEVGSTYTRHHRRRAGVRIDRVSWRSCAPHVFLCSRFHVACEGLPKLRPFRTAVPHCGTNYPKKQVVCPKNGTCSPRRLRTHVRQTEHDLD